MSNNMTRKGLAVGAGLGLLATGLVGITPANAAETLALAPTTGTSYKVLTSSDFNLTVGFVGTESAAAVNTVKYMVTNASGATMAFDVYAAGGNGGTTVDYVPGTTTDAAATATSVVVYDDTTDAIGSRSGLLLSITPVADTSASISVQAWLDIDGDNVIDASEATSPVRTVEFVDHASVAATASLDSAVVGAGTLSATVSIPGFNMDQLDSDDVQLEFYRNNVIIGDTVDTAASASGTGHTAAGAAVSVAARTNPVAAAWSAADAEMRGTLYVDDTDTGAADTVYTLVANSATAVYSAKVRLNDGTAMQLVANSASGATPASGVVTSLTDVTELNGTSTDQSNNIRKGSGSFTVKTTAAVATGESKAGQTVTWVIQENGANTLATAATVTAGGKTLTNSNIATVQKITVTSVTNALGVATLTIDYTGLAAGDDIDVKASALGASAVITPTTATQTYVGVASDVATIASNVNAGKLQTVIGQNFSVTWTLADTFGQVPVGTYRLVLSENGNGNYATTIPFVNGVATFTQLENSTSANAYTLSADVEQQNTDLTWDNTPTAGNAALAGDVAVQAYATDPTVASVSVSANDAGVSTAGTALDLTLDDFVSTNTTVTANSLLLPTIPANNVNTDNDATYDDGQATLTYTVTSSTGEALVGEPITVSAANVQFLNGSNLYGAGSISGTTDGNGQFVVKVFSNKAGKHTVTAVAGGVTKTKDMTFRTAKADTGYTVTVSAPTSVKAGSSFKVSATVVDSYGNPVVTDSTATGYLAGTTTPTFSFTYTGPGLIATTMPTKTGASGVAEFSVLLGANDSGPITVTATYDADGTATAKAAITATAKVNEVVATPAADTKVNAGSFKGYVAVYAKGYEGKRLSAKVGNDWVVVPALASNFVRVVEFTGAGYTIAVRIYIDRVLVDTITVTTK